MGVRTLRAVRHKLQARGSWCQASQCCQQLSTEFFSGQSGVESQATLNSCLGLDRVSSRLIPGRLQCRGARWKGTWQSSGCSRETGGGGFYIRCLYFKSPLNRSIFRDRNGETLFACLPYTPQLGIEPPHLLVYRTMLQPLSRPARATLAF